MSVCHCAATCRQRARHWWSVTLTRTAVRGPPPPTGRPWQHPRKSPDLRAHVYDLLRDGLSTGGLALLARAIAENPDGYGLLLLVELETDPTHPLAGWQTIERVVTEHVPSENWKGAYDIVPIPALEVRRRLLAMTTDGRPSDAAARSLNEIDKIRDEYGAPETEPRHPDLKSGKPWPIMTCNPGGD